jgi:predicted PurR-regulated permease PerM
LPNESILQERLRVLLFYGIVLFLAYLTFLIVSPFLAPLAWAAVLVVLTYPVYERLVPRTGPAGAALITTAGVLLVIMVPLIFVMIAFVRQGVQAVHTLQFKFESGHFVAASNFWERLQERFPSLGSNDLPDTLQEYGQKAAGFVASKLGAILQHTAVFVFHLFVTVLVMFYLYRDGESLMERFRELLPFAGANRDRMLSDARQLIFASVTSSLLAAAAHGLLGAVAFAAAGLSAPIFWGVMMGFFSFVPIVGTALIWVPLAASLMIGGHWVRGLVVLALCALIVTVVDNVLRPWLISGRTEAGGLLIFLGVLGGIGAFGLLGLVLGPVVLAMVAILLEVYAAPDSSGNTGPRHGGKKAKAVLE